MQHIVELSPIYVSHVIDCEDEDDGTSIAADGAVTVINQHALVNASHEVNSLSAIATGIPAQQWAPALHA